MRTKIMTNFDALPEHLVQENTIAIDKKIFLCNSNGF